MRTSFNISLTIYYLFYKYTCFISIFISILYILVPEAVYYFLQRHTEAPCIRLTFFVVPLQKVGDLFDILPPNDVSFVFPISPNTLHPPPPITHTL